MAIQKTLLERIRNPDPAGHRQMRASTNEIFESILTNLQNILNTNQGNCLTDEHYGLPHLGSLREYMPQSVSAFVSAIQSTIERLEPRLSNLRVRHSPGDGRGMSLRFEITGLVKDEDNRINVRFETFADEEGRMKVR
jgi:type VI secretion system protein